MKIVAQEGNKITDKKRSFFCDYIFCPEWDKDNYEEVGYEIWGAFSENELPKNKVEELNSEIATLKVEKEELKENIEILQCENSLQGEVIESMMLKLLDLICPEVSELEE